MTLREAIRAEVQIPGIYTGSIDKAAIDLGLDPESLYSAGNGESVKQAAISILKNLRGQKTISEGDFTITLDPASINIRIGILTGGDEEITTGPTVTAKKVW